MPRALPSKSTLPSPHTPPNTWLLARGTSSQQNSSCTPSAFSSLRASRPSQVLAARHMRCVFQLYSGYVSNRHRPPVRYSLSYPIQNITLSSYEALSSFTHHVPKPYYHHIRSLSLCLKPSLAGSGPIDQTSALINVLSLVTRVESLSLHFIGSPAKSIIPSFYNFRDLRSLHVSNCGDEDAQPLCVHFPFSANSVSER